MKRFQVIIAVAAVAATVFLISSLSNAKKATRRILTNAYIARGAGALMLESYTVDTVISYSSSERGKIITKALAEAAADVPAPSLFAPKQKLDELGLATAQYSQLIREPRGTWMTYQSELASLRTKLDGAILAVERSVSADKLKKEAAESAQQRVAEALGEIATLDANDQKRLDKAREAEEKRSAEQQAAVDALYKVQWQPTPSPAPPSPEEIARRAREASAAQARDAAARERRIADHGRIRLEVRGVSFTEHVPGGPFRVKATVANIGPVSACNVRVQATPIGTEGKGGTRVPRVAPGEQVETPVGWLVTVTDGRHLKNFDVRIMEFEACE